MYKEIYTIPFKSIEENSYNIIIEKKGFTGSSEEVTGASSPFVVEVDLESPLKPFRLSTATLSVYGGDYLQSLFTPNPQGVRVKLLKNGSVEWLGFITNDTYSQDYSNIEFVYEIELVNPLSSLKHSKYKSNLVNRTFIELIKEAITETNSEIKSVYFPTSYTNDLEENIYELIKVSSGNFFDEQDEAMSYYEILEEIAMYLGLTITIDKDIVYFIDYVGIGKEYNEYFKYNLALGTVTQESLIHNSTIQSLGYVSDSSSLQINSGRNKAKVTCSLYNVDNVLPEFNSEGAEYLFMKRKIYAWGEDDNKISNAYVARFFEQDKYTFYKYGYDGVAVNPPAEGGGGRPGATNPWDEDDDPSQDRIKGSWFVRTGSYPRTSITAREPIAELSLTNEVLVRRYSDIEQARLGNVLREVPVFSIKSDKSYNFMPNTPLVLNFDIKFLENNPLYWQEGESNKGKAWKETLDFKVKIRIGEYYFNGVRKWSKEEQNYNTWVIVDKEDFYGQYYSYPNNNHFEMGITDEKGYLVITPDWLLSGDIEVTIYNPVFDDIVVNGKTHTFITRYRPFMDLRSYPQYMLIKGIRLSHTGKDPNNIWGDRDDEDKDSDIVYENDIDEKYVEEADKIELKICTYPDDYYRMCESTTYLGDNLLRTLDYKPLNVIDKPEVVLINKALDYYKEPKYEVSIPVSNKELYPYSIITDSNLPNKRFIYAGSEIDYEYEKNTINILEI